MAVSALAASSAIAVGTPSSSAADGTPDCPVTYAGSVATATCGFTGGPQTFTVPPGVSTLSVTVDGASGGSVEGIAHGGNGGEVSATLEEPPGTVLTVIVGEAGLFGGGRTYGGGGAPGHGSLSSASGGGGSFVQTADGTNLLVGGGGGGAANWGCGQFGAADGGAGGGSVGQAGSSTCPSGAGGAGGRQGGTGVGQGTDGADISSGASGPGGGGGGGYAGGKGGQVVEPSSTELGGGGGGGSGYCVPESDCEFTTGAHNGNGQVTFSWDISPADITSADAAAFTVAAKGTFTVDADGLPIPSLSVPADSLPDGLTFSDNGDGTGTLGGTPGAGTAGTYSIDVAANSPAGDETQVLTLTIGAATPTVTVVADPAAETDAGEDVTLTATVTGGAGPATGGSVDFAVAGTDLCRAVSVNDGVARCVTDDLPAGQITVTAAYSGDTATYTGGEGSVDYQVRAAATESSDPGAPTSSLPDTSTSTRGTSTLGTASSAAIDSPSSSPVTAASALPDTPADAATHTTAAQTLATTGTASGPRLLTGLVLLLAGVGLVGMGRRRRGGQH